MDLLIPSKRPRIRQKVQAPDQRSITVCPIRAASDRRMTAQVLRALLILCSYTNKAGVAWVSLERIGKDLSVSRPRAGQLVKKLTELGYVRVIHKGFKGYCADSRQVIFNPDITADQAAAVAGELAPYQVEQQRKEAEQMQAEQDKKQAKLAARAKRKGKGQAIAESNQVSQVDRLGLLEDYTQYANVDADILQLAIEAVGPGATPAQIDQAIDDLLR
jgi:DNA-binding transcriptional ArsR family regulator